MDSCGCAVQADGDSPSRNGCKRKNPAKDAVSPRLLLGFICGEERCGILKQSKAAVIIKFLKAYLCYHVQTAIARGKVIIVDLTIVYAP